MFQIRKRNRRAEQPNQMAVVKCRFVRACLFITGIFSVAIGIIGVFLPVLPTTPFILLAAWCFLKSSEEAHQWIYRQPVMGQLLRNWDETHSISRNAKLVALGMIVMSWIFVCIKMHFIWLKLLVSILLFSVCVFIFTRNEGTRR